MLQSFVNSRALDNPGVAALLMKTLCFPPRCSPMNDWAASSPSPPQPARFHISWEVAYTG